jgi:hypothetical protein
MAASTVRFSMDGGLKVLTARTAGRLEVPKTNRSAKPMLTARGKRVADALVRHMGAA